MDQELLDEKVIDSFLVYCQEHPEERFWQALRNWADVDYVFAGYASKKEKTDTAYLEDIGLKVYLKDTFNFTGKNE